MVRWRVGPWLHACGDPVMDVTPMIRINLGWIDRQSFHRINDLKDALDLRPALDLQQNLTAGPHKGQGLKGLTFIDGAYDIDAR